MQGKCATRKPAKVKRTSGSEGLLREKLGGDGLVGNGGNELVVDDVDLQRGTKNP